MKILAWFRFHLEKSVMVVSSVDEEAEFEQEDEVFVLFGVE